MNVVKNYQHFDGRHYDTGPIHNILAYQGQPAPHTGEPLSEALLLGISGGIAFGYFLFEYEGYPPHVALLTRNTFDPMQTLLDRLALPREVLQTSKPDVGLKNLMVALESGHPAIVWADMWMLPYNRLGYHPQMWAMFPIVVYGVEGDRVYIADRSCQPLTITLEELMQARARVKDDKFRVMTLDKPDMDKLPSAVQKGIWQCISLYTDAPPKGKRENFGFAGLQHWADMLTNKRNKRSWERFFPAGSRLYAALAGDLVQPGAYGWLTTWNVTDGAERNLYADFLDEAALVLNKPDLKSAAVQFRNAAIAWQKLAQSFLPDHVPPFKETRELKRRKHHLFIEQGINALDEIREIQNKLEDICASMSKKFPLTDNEVANLREDWRAQILNIHDIEREAVEHMQSAIS